MNYTRHRPARGAGLAIAFALSACSEDSSVATAPAGDRRGADETKLLRPPKRNFIGVYHPLTSEWSLRMRRPGWIESAGADITFRFGSPGSTPLVGDWDGDGRETQGVWKDGRWSLCNTLAASQPDVTFSFGDATYLPVVGDWDGDGTSTPGLFRAGTFLLANRLAPDKIDIVLRFGQAGDIPIAGDWNRDGVDTVGVYRPSTGEFFLSHRAGVGPASWTAAVFGQAGDSPVVGDFDADGIPTIGVKRGSHWLLKTRLGVSFVDTFGDTAPDIYEEYGAAADRPVTGNWDPLASRGSSAIPRALEGFFPLAVDYQRSETFAKWKARGINTVIRVPASPVSESIDTWTTAANRQGLMMIRAPRPDPARDLAEPRLLAWEIYDEPDGGGTTGLGRLREQRMNLKRFADRPVFFNFVGGLVLDPVDASCNGPGDYGGAPSTCYRDLISAEDWVSNDVYPVNARLPLEVVGETLSKLARWSSGKPQFAYIEASNIWNRGEWPAPNPGQFRAEVWLAIIRGARGIFYFPHGSCNTGECLVGDAVPPDLVEEMAVQNAHITHLASVLQTEIDPTGIALVAPTPLQAGWRQSGGESYFFVLNLSNVAITRTMRVVGPRPVDALAVVFEDRQVRVSDEQTIADTFAPYQVHIYRLPE